MTPGRQKPAPRARRSGRAPDLDALSDRALLGLRLCDLGLRLRGTELEARAAVVLRRARSVAGSGFGRTSGCRPSGSRRTACPASRSRSTWRTRGCRRSRRSRWARSKAAAQRSFLQLMRHEAGARARLGLSAARARGLARGVRLVRARRTTATTSPSPHSKRFVRYLDEPGTRRAIRPRTSPRPWRCGSIRSRAGARATAAGRHSEAVYVNRLMREIAGRRAAGAPARAARADLGADADLARLLRARSADAIASIGASVYERDLTRLFRERKRTRCDGREGGALPAARTTRDPKTGRRDSTGALDYDIDRVLREDDRTERGSRPGGRERDDARRERRGTTRSASRPSWRRYLAQGHHRYVR